MEGGRSVVTAPQNHSCAFWDRWMPTGLCACSLTTVKKAVVCPHFKTGRFHMRASNGKLSSNICPRGPAGRQPQWCKAGGVASSPEAPRSSHATRSFCPFKRLSLLPNSGLCFKIGHNNRHSSRSCKRGEQNVFPARRQLFA